MKTGAIVLAAGSGSRMRSNIKKQYMEINEKPLIYYALQAFEDSFTDEVVLVVSPGDIDYCKAEIVDKYGFTKVKRIVEGGAERYDSVRLGLHAISEDTDYVMIHDGARPFVSEDIMQRSVDAARDFRACVVGMPVKDTIKVSDENGFAKATPDRKTLWMIQTPQTFEYSLIRKLYDKLEEDKEEIKAKGINITDDAMVVETFSDVKVKLVEGSYNNIKVTTPEDIGVAQAILG
jgi:2-C-methyl-D-erythritol 4-phosphate cytidylyltransferase